MTFLMVNLNNPADCRKAMVQLRGVLGKGVGKSAPGSPRGCGPGRNTGRRQKGEKEIGNEAEPIVDGELAETSSNHDTLHSLPLRAKLQRMKHRGVWRHLVSIANQGDVAKSLAELDKQLDFQPNKMRSLKAIMAKLENRFGLRFLEVDPDAGSDEAGNPRYSMPARVRKQILRLAD